MYSSLLLQCHKQIRVFSCDSLSLHQSIPRRISPRTHSSMTTIAAFNALLNDFITDLSNTFDDVPQMTIFKTTLPVLLASDERQGLTLFMDAVRPYAERILKSDRTVFEDPENSVTIGGLNVSELWNVDGIDEGSKTAIMNYLNTLLALGMALENLNDDMLGSIESMAKEAATTMEQGGSIDFKAMLPALMQNVGTLLGADMPDMNDPKVQGLLDTVLSSCTGLGFDDFAAGDNFELEDSPEDMDMQ